MTTNPNPETSRRRTTNRRFFGCADMARRSRSEHPFRTAAKRPGSILVLVLSSAMIVAVIGLAAVMAVRVERRGAAWAGDFAEARLYAWSAVEVGQWMMHNDQTWRTTRAQGNWKLDQPIGRGKYTLNAVDPVDADFSDNVDDPVVFTAAAAVGKALYKLSVRMEPYGPRGMDCLASAIHVANSLETIAAITADAPLSSNGTIHVKSTGSVNANLEAVGTITVDGSASGTQTTGIAAKEMPASSVFDYYITNAVEIPYASISGGTIDRKVLAPGLNTQGGTLHPQGMYLIRCNGNRIRISDSRIHGTLILLDTSSDSEIAGAIHWEPTDPALPALLVRGPMIFSWTGDLSESSTGTNFNPVGAPYQGATDNDSTDSYPGHINGLVYVSGNLTTSAAQSVLGTLVVAGSSASLGGNLTVTHDPNLIENPPPGFLRTYRPMLPVPGTWQRIVN